MFELMTILLEIFLGDILYPTLLVFLPDVWIFLRKMLSTIVVFFRVQSEISILYFAHFPK